MASESLLFATVLIGSLVAAPSPPAQEDPFTIRAETLFAVERGPVVVRVILRYQGRERIRVRQSFIDSNSRIKWPPHWSRREPELVGFDGIPRGSRTMNRGDEWAEIHYLHHDYEDIPSGQVKLQIQWPVYSADKSKERAQVGRLFPQTPIIARPSVILHLDVPKTTPARVAEIARRIEQDLNRPRLSDDQMKHLFEVVLHSRHPEFIPLTVKLLDRECLNYPKARFIPFIYDCARTPSEAHAALVDYVLAPQPVAADAVFWYWRNLRWRSSWAYVCQDLQRRGSLVQHLIVIALQPKQWLIVERLIDYVQVKRLTLPASALRRLWGAPNIWVRTLAYATFPERCDRAWAAGLMKDLRRLNNPLPPEEFKHLLRQLDDGKFAVRERAAAELLCVGDGVEPALRNALKRPLSLELRRRIERLLTRINRERPDPLRRHTLADVAWMGTPEARAVLETLSRGLPQARLTKEAAAALKEMKQQQRVGR